MILSSRRYEPWVFNNVFSFSSFFIDIVSKSEVRYLQANSNPLRLKF